MGQQLGWCARMQCTAKLIHPKTSFSRRLGDKLNWKLSTFRKDVMPILCLELYHEYFLLVLIVILVKANENHWLNEHHNTALDLYDLHKDPLDEAESARAQHSISGAALAQLMSEWQQWTNINTDLLMFGHKLEWSKVANNHDGVNPYLVAACSLTLFMTHGHVMRTY